MGSDFTPQPAQQQLTLAQGLLQRRQRKSYSPPSPCGGGAHQPNFTDQEAEAPRGEVASAWWAARGGDGAGLGTEPLPRGFLSGPLH